MSDTTGGTPFWLTKNGLLQSYTNLEEAIDTDILVVGGGITGALVARAFARSGERVTVIEKRHIATGSTAASTALLQYEIDVPLTELIKKIGKVQAERAYMLCAETISTMKTIAEEFPDACGFRLKPSMYIAAQPHDMEFLHREYLARKTAGLSVVFLGKEELAERGITASGAIYSDLGAEIDPYLLTHAIFTALNEAGHSIYERTELALDTLTTSDTHTTAYTTSGHRIRAQKIIFATGYEAAGMLKEHIVTRKSSYAIVTEKIPEEDLCLAPAFDSLLWDTNTPYLYARTTPDGRILIGGEDVFPRNAFLRDILISWKARKLIKKFSRYLTETPVKQKMKIAFSWSGTFGETEDGLAYIGESPEWPDCYFALGFGGNGILYSAIAGTLLTDLYHGIPNSDLDLFRFGRSSKPELSEK